MEKGKEIERESKTAVGNNEQRDRNRDRERERERERGRENGRENWREETDWRVFREQRLDCERVACSR